MTGLPGFLNHDTPLNRALLTVAWHRTDPFADAFDGLAGDIAELAGLDRDVVVRELAGVADALNDWAKCCDYPIDYARGRGIARSVGETWDGFREAECDVLAAGALSDVARLIESAGLAAPAETPKHAFEPGVDVDAAEIARLIKVREWAMVNEIAVAPLDWAGLGAILNPLAAQVATWHEFREDVGDYSMCVCGVPGLTHDAVFPASARPEPVWVEVIDTPTKPPYGSAERAAFDASRLAAPVGETPAESECGLPMAEHCAECYRPLPHTELEWRACVLIQDDRSTRAEAQR